MDTVLAISIGTLSTIILAGILTFMILAWFAVRYWLSNSADSSLADIKTPTIDRLNAAALEKFDDPQAVAKLAEDESAPADLLAVVPREDTESATQPPGGISQVKSDSVIEQNPSEGR